MNNTPVQRTVEQINEVLKASAKPMTTGELGNALNLTSQSIRNHIPEAIERGYIVLSKTRIGKANLYESTSRRHQILPTVKRGEEYIILRDVLIALTNEDTRKQWLYKVNSTYAIVAGIVQKLFIRASNALDENEPTPVALSDLKLFKQTLRQRRTEIVEEIAAIDSMLNNDDLWSPKEMPKALLINDDELIDSKHVNQILKKVIR